LNSIKKEVEQLKEQMIEMANIQGSGKYIFNGTDTDQKPNQDGKIITEAGREEMVRIEVSKGINMAGNVSPEVVFDQELFDQIHEFITALEAGDDDELNNSLGNLQESSSNIIQARAELGARMNRLELIEDRLEKQVVIVKDTMAK